MKLKLTNNGAILVTQILSFGGFSTPIEVLRAGLLMEKVEVKIPHIDDQVKHIEWLKKDFKTIDLTDNQVEILKTAINKVADKLPPGKVINSILTQLGFTE